MENFEDKICRIYISKTKYYNELTRNMANIPDERT